ncbi:MAG: RnfABCDGE type electron transport complex subunit D [Acidobacteriota bacterium]
MEEQKPRDPRRWQILALASLLTYGVTVLDFDVVPAVALTLVGVAVLTQWLASRAVGLPRFEVKSALISSLSLCLLLRAASPREAAVVAVITILSKFTVRARGKHVFNPTNFGLVVGLLCIDGVWVSPGQWGSAAVAGFFFLCLGVFVVHRSRRTDVTWAFLAAWGGVLFGRALWLGDPLTIPWHQLQNGALLLFAFFMISDPKTTPNSRAGRIAWAVLVATVAGYWQFALFKPNGLLFALVLSAPAVPLLDRLVPGERYDWGAAPTPSVPTPKGPLSSAPISTPAAAAQPTPVPLALSRSRSRRRRELPST